METTKQKMAPDWTDEEFLLDMRAKFELGQQITFSEMRRMLYLMLLELPMVKNDESGGSTNDE